MRDLHQVLVFVTIAVAASSEVADCQSTSCVADVPTATATDTIVSLPPPVPGVLQVYGLPVGQGDCTIIQCPNGNVIVFDCGSSSTAQGWGYVQVQNFLGNSINNVQIIMLTHGDSDHSNYLPLIPWNANILQRIIIGGVVGDYSQRPIDVRGWLQGFQQRVHTVNNGQECIGNCMVNGGTNFCGNVNIQFSILAANVGPSSNEKSIIMKVTYGAWSMLLPGDIEGRAATSIANTIGGQLQSTVYKMAHHGASRLANLPTWLQQIRPAQSFASNAYNFGSCRHPRCETITRLITLMTLATAGAHQLDCGNSAPNPPTVLNPFCHFIYATAPTATDICVIEISSAGTGTMVPNCMPAADITTGLSEDDIIDDDDRIDTVDNGGAVGIEATFYAVLFSLVVSFSYYD